MASLITLQRDGLSPTLADAAKLKYIAALGGVPTSPWGHVWAEKRDVVLLVPSDEMEEMREPPLVFMDETYDADAKTFATARWSWVPGRRSPVHSGTWKPC